MKSRYKLKARLFLSLVPLISLLSLATTSFAQLTISDLTGDYAVAPAQNDWHEGRIDRFGSGLLWINKAGKSWRVTPDFTNQQLLTGDRNPYKNQGMAEFKLLIRNGQVLGFKFGADTYWKKVNGMAVPRPHTSRYLDMGNGTVNDTVTQLVWLKDPSCFTYLSSGNWSSALAAAKNLSQNICQLNDGSKAGQWRLPTKTEWNESLAPTRTSAGFQEWQASRDSAFPNLALGFYWSSSDAGPKAAWGADLNTAWVSPQLVAASNESRYIWPVRDDTMGIASNASSPSSDQNQQAKSLAAAREQASLASQQTRTERSETVKEAFITIRENLKGDTPTFYPVREKRSKLIDGAEKRIVMGRFEPGYFYEVFGVCDDGCVDLDLQLFDKDGREVDVDDDDDNSPDVDVTPPFGEVYSALVTMSDCMADPCEYGLKTVRRALQTRATLTRKSAEVAAEIDEAYTELKSEGFSRQYTRKGRLVETGYKKEQFGQFTGNNEYIVYAYCDDDCGDIELQVTDASGRVIESDSGSSPNVSITPTSSRTYGYRITMESCGEAPCSFGVNAVRRRTR